MGNLGGLTSYLLSLDNGRTAAALRADVLIPVLGYKRALNKQTGYGGSPDGPTATHSCCCVQRLYEQPSYIPSLTGRLV